MAGGGFRHVKESERPRPFFNHLLPCPHGALRGQFGGMGPVKARHKHNRKGVKKPSASMAVTTAHKALRLHGLIARDLGVLIVSGRYRPGHVLDGEVEASSQRRVSRTAYREAVRILAAKGLVHSRPRVG